MLADIDLKQIPTSSIHEPCPATISADQLKRQDMLISSPDEERRREGVKSICWSIDLAKELGVKAIVIHCGMLQVDPALERKLVALLEAGQAGTPEYLQTREQMIKIRQEQVEPCIAAVQKSLRELLAHAGNSGIRLGLENRYHFFDLPSPDEMALFLTLADTDQLGLIYDTGHAHALDRLGFYPETEWLQRFSDRIIGTHLHDAVGIQDHQAPGVGEIDFKMVADHLPKTAFRTLEIKSLHSIEEIRKGLLHLVDTGCIHPAQGGTHAQVI